MLTNTYKPHVGGVARSVEFFAHEYRRVGNRVTVVAPTFENLPPDEADVIRVPAIQNFNGSDFSVPVPAPGLISSAMGDTVPDVIHAHHPFLLGDTALRLAATYGVPVVFTHHTLYDQYTHYLGGESAALSRMAIEIAVGYCNLVDGVIAPSESVATMLREHGVTVPIEVIPTGVDTARFAEGDGLAFRAAHDIPRQAFVVGHVGRLAPEKNLSFLASAVAEFLASEPQAYFMIVGTGPLEDEIKATFEERSLSNRLRMVGLQSGQDLVNAYRAMDVFAFASQSETQGMVLTEAMAAGAPVVALDGPGVRDVLVDGQNGRLLTEAAPAEFASALEWVRSRNELQRTELKASALATADRFSMPRTAAQALAFYEQLKAKAPQPHEIDDSPWAAAVRWLDAEWKILTHHAKAVGGAIVEAVTADTQETEK